MDSILDKILTQKHAEEIRGFDPVAMVHGLMTDLSEREREVVARRFGLPETNQVETLEEIGERLQVTRERIRQITKNSLTRLAQLGAKHEDVQRFSRVAEHLLRSYGGALEDEYFVRQLLDFAGIRPGSDSWNRASTSLRFLLAYVLAESIEHRTPSGALRAVYALRGSDSKILSDIATAFLAIVDGENHPLGSADLVERFRRSPVCQEHYQTIIAEPVKIARDFYGSGLDPQAPPTPEEDSRVVLAYAASVADLDQNIFGEWGRSEWTTIRPRRMNDKIYLILRQEKKPLHFTDIAERINAAHFDKKIAKPPSVHNELILDKRFVLVGRGLYALKEWGYEPGTVADVISELLKDIPNGLTREEIVNAVLKRRVVKRQTIHLALMNHDKFEKLPDGKFRLVVSGT